MNEFIAHTAEDGRRQTVGEHLRNTAALAAVFASRFGAARFGEVCGLAHDIGKYSPDFQKRILKGGARVDHSTAGAQELCRRYGMIPAYAAAGHHGGLPDIGSSSDLDEAGTLLARLKRKVPDYSAFAGEITFPTAAELEAQIRPLGRTGYTQAFFTRMLFSCLVDADYLDTERFMQTTPVRRGEGEALDTLLLKLEEALHKMARTEPPINRFRGEILACCQKKARLVQGLFTLTVPTGGGKTLSSLAFALGHAVEHELVRVIYVVPYQSIIEQTADIFRGILGDQNVLEHHSGVYYDDASEDMHPHRLAAENWDAPVIVTTAVQFFESLHANMPSRCRKLHNIAQSVVIFDEAQMLPYLYLKPCVRAIAELVWNYRVSAVLCTATQPALESLFPREIKVVELCDNAERYYRLFRRTRFVRCGRLDDRELAGRMASMQQALCIVNTRKQAQVLFTLLPQEGAYHLSTLMYPEHRKRVLKAIREDLAAGRVCRVVSTSLVEAGVDVDFPAVLRAESGLDSEIQAAGRCNRNGKHPDGLGTVYLFTPEEQYAAHYPDALKLPMEVARMIADSYEDISSLEAVRDYFKKLYAFKGQGLDDKKILPAMSGENGSFPFGEIAKAFRMIESETMQVLVPLEGEAEMLAARLRQGERTRELMRAIGRYSVGIYPQHYRRLTEAGMIEPFDDGLGILADERGYSPATGLSMDIQPGYGIIW